MLVLILAAVIFLAGGFMVGYVVQNGGLAGLPSILGFGSDKDEDVDWANKTLTTGDNIVNVRVTPSNDGDILVTLNKNTEVVCLKDENEDWCYVRVLDDVEGYVVKSFMTVVGDYVPTEDTEDGTGDSAAQGFVSPVGDFANIREEASSDSDIVGVAISGDILEKVSEEGEWVKVKTAEGVEGYISSELVSDTQAEAAENAERKEVVITNSYANIRSEPSADAEQVEKLYEGDTVTYLGEENGWYYILLDDGETAYVRNDLAEVSE